MDIEINKESIIYGLMDSSKNIYQGKHKGQNKRAYKVGMPSQLFNCRPDILRKKKG